MGGFDRRDEAERLAQECGGSVVTAWDGTYCVVGSRSPDRGRWLAGPDWHGYERDLGASAVAYLTGGPDAAAAVS